MFTPRSPPSTDSGTVFSIDCGPGYIRGASASRVYTLTCLPTGSWTTLPICHSKFPLYQLNVVSDFFCGLLFRGLLFLNLFISPFSLSTFSFSFCLSTTLYLSFSFSLFFSLSHSFYLSISLSFALLSLLLPLVSSSSSCNLPIKSSLLVMKTDNLFYTSKKYLFLCKNSLTKSVPPSWHTCDRSLSWF